MTLIRFAESRDVAAMAAVYNQGIAERGATFETRPRTPDDVHQWLASANRHPVLVAVEAGDQVVGWANLSAYRPRDCYAGIAEFSVYLDKAARGRGIGAVLLRALVDVARDRGYWKLLSRIFTFNEASRALCRAAGFREVGIYEKHGQLDGRWLDVVIVERVIPENLSPPVTQAATVPAATS